MSASTHISTPDTTRDRVDDLRSALRELLGAERRLRGRDQHQLQGGLTIAQLWALRVLEEGEKTAGEIAEAALCNPASTTAMLDSLEERGVVQRRRSTEDRRVVLVTLTDAGREVVADKRAHSQGLWQEKFAGTPEGDLETAAAVMRVIAEMLDAH
jgi:MarR family transcriptional regulator, organic hydroperoxide resistance regulator